MNFRFLSPALRLALWVQALGLGAGCVLMLLAMFTEGMELAIPAGVCASLSPLAGTAGLVLMAFGRGRGRRGPWEPGLLALAGFDVLSTPLIFLGWLASSFAYKDLFATPLGLNYYLSIGVALIALPWGVVALFQPHEGGSGG